MKSLIKTLPWNNLGPFSTRLKPPQALLVDCLLFSIMILNRDDIDAPFGLLAASGVQRVFGWSVSQPESHTAALTMFSSDDFTMDLSMLREGMLLGLATSFESLQHQEYNKMKGVFLQSSLAFHVSLLRNPLRHQKAFLPAC